MIDSEYVKLNTSIQTGSNAENILLHETENDTIPAEIELRLPQNLFPVQRGKNKLEKVDVLTTKFRISMQDTPIAELDIDTDKTTNETIVLQPQLDVYPFCLGDKNIPKPEGLLDSAFPAYKSHTVQYIFYLCENPPDGEKSELTNVHTMANTYNYGLGRNTGTFSPYELVILNHLGKKYDHEMNFILPSTHGMVQQGNNHVLIKDVGTLQHVFQSALENAITYACTSTNMQVNVYLIPKSQVSAVESIYLDEEIIVPNHDPMVIWYVEDNLSSIVNNCSLLAACKPTVEFNEQSFSISYDTGVFDQIIPVIWNSQHINTFDIPDQMSTDTYRSSVWGLPPLKRQYRYGVDVQENDTFSYTLESSLKPCVMNIIANKNLVDSFSFLPWIKTTMMGYLYNKTVTKEQHTIEKVTKTESKLNLPLSRPGQSNYFTVIVSEINTGGYTYRFKIRNEYVDETIPLTSGGTLSFEDFNKKYPETYRQVHNFRPFEDGWGTQIANGQVSLTQEPPTNVVNYNNFILSESTTPDIPVTETLISYQPISESTSVKILDSDTTYQNALRSIDYSSRNIGFYRDERSESDGIQFPMLTGDKKYSFAYPISSGANGGIPKISPSSITFNVGTSLTDVIVNFNVSGNTLKEYIEVLGFTSTFANMNEFREYSNNMEEETRIHTIHEIDEYYPNIDSNATNELYILDATTAQMKMSDPEPISAVGIESTVSNYQCVSDSPANMLKGTHEETWKCGGYDTETNTIKNRPINHIYISGVHASVHSPLSPGTWSDINTACIMRRTVTSYEPGVEPYVKYDDCIILPPGERPVLRYTDWETDEAYRTSGPTPTVWGDVPQAPSEIGDYGLVSEAYTTRQIQSPHIGDILQTTSTPDYTTKTSYYQRTVSDYVDTLTSNSVQFHLRCPDLQEGAEDIWVPGYFIDPSYHDPSIPKECVFPYAPFTSSLPPAKEAEYVIKTSLVTGDLEETKTCYFIAYYEEPTSSFFDVMTMKMQWPDTTVFSLPENTVTRYCTFEYRDECSVIFDAQAISALNEYMTAKGNTQLTFTWNNLPIVCLSPISSIVLCLQGLQISQEIQPVNITADALGSSLTSVFPIVENYYSLAQTLRDLHDELIVVKEDFDVSTKYNMVITSGQDRVLKLSAHYITKNGNIYQIYIPTKGVFNVQLTFRLTYSIY